MVTYGFTVPNESPTPTGREVFVRDLKVGDEILDPNTGYAGEIASLVNSEYNGIPDVEITFTSPSGHEPDVLYLAPTDIVEVYR